MAKSRFGTRLASSVLTGSIQGGNPEDKVHEPPAHYQLVMPLEESQTRCQRDNLPDIEQELARLLTLDLTFKGSNTKYASHQLHAFAAKFPLQIPRLFIQALTRPGEWVLDPMAGSGTALVEAIIAGRCAIGVDLDPLAAMIAKVKTTPLDLPQCAKIGTNVLFEARANLHPLTDDDLCHVYSPKSVAFFRYWFEEHTVNELFALVDAINQVEDPSIQAFLKVVFSSCIITKSGGLTRARDLAHSRPHRDLNKRITQSAFDAFRDRLNTAISLIEESANTVVPCCVIRADARDLPLPSESVHLIVTSPPYAANAIDYMRAHKFALIWFGFEPERLTALRRQYIGAELLTSRHEFPSETANRLLHELRQIDKRRASVVAHYYHDMEVALREMLRVLMAGRAAILVVGSSTIRGVEIHAPTVIADLAASVGFRIVGVATREILRDARMMPVSRKSERKGIEARMHEEGVIGLIKPQGGMCANT